MRILMTAYVIFRDIAKDTHSIRPQNVPASWAVDIAKVFKLLVRYPSLRPVTINAPTC